VELLRKGRHRDGLLLVISTLAVAVVWRYVALRRATTGLTDFMRALRERLVKADVSGAIKVCERSDGPVAAIVKAGLLRSGRPKDEVQLALQDASAHELTVLERGLPVLATTAMIAPLLGFLGTVTGMITRSTLSPRSGSTTPARWRAASPRR
jgi:biopolymer transport protein ExbB